MFAVVWKCLHCFLNKTQNLLQTDVDLSMALWGKGHLDVFLLRVYFFILKMSRLLLHSCLSCCLRFCFNKFIWFFISSISLSLLLDVCFVLEGTLAANFLWRYCVWDGCNNSSFLKSWWFVFNVYFTWFYQRMNFWIDNPGVSLNDVCIKFPEVCLSSCLCFVFYWLGFVF